MTEPKKKKEKLVDISASRLLSLYTTTVRNNWERAVARRMKLNPGHDSEYQRELAIKREIMRRFPKE